MSITRTDYYSYSLRNLQAECERLNEELIADDVTAEETFKSLLSGSSSFNKEDEDSTSDKEEEFLNTKDEEIRD